MVFRPLDGGRGLRADEFPLTLNSIEVAVARTQVTGSLLEGYMCQGTDGGGMVTMQIEIHAGETPPTGSITTLPESGPWPGETMVFGESIELTLSEETTPGSQMYDVMFNTIPVMSGVRIEPPNTYIRVAISIPGGGSSASCSELGITPPGAVGIRDDDGRIANNVGFIYALNPLGGLGGISEGWHWNEDPEISDPSTGETGINGEWAIRLNVTPEGSSTRDAGTAMPDAGAVSMDAGSTEDAGSSPSADGGSTTMCIMDADCAGGERCVDGMCQRVACTAASDCAGGMTCVEGMCRNLCSADAECAGGEVCDTDMGHCVPVGSLDDGGCGCRVASPRTPTWPLAALPLVVVGMLLRLRRRR
jgi:MYXO-CTERM domain-containing protein